MDGGVADTACNTQAVNRQKVSMRPRSRERVASRLMLMLAPPASRSRVSRSAIRSSPEAACGGCECLRAGEIAIKIETRMKSQHDCSKRLWLGG